MTLDISNGVPMRFWGKDHWSTLLYIESICVDNQGKPDHRRLQSNMNRHPQFCKEVAGYTADGSGYEIRLAKGLTIPGDEYDEYDCIDDIERAGFIEVSGHGIDPIYKMTINGMAVAGALRFHKSKGKGYAEFNLYESG